MKKSLFSVWFYGVLVACALSLLLVSCGGGGGGGSDDYVAPVAESGSTTTNISVVLVQGATFNGATAITGSQVFIENRTVNIPSLLVCDHEVTQEEFQSVMGSNPSGFSGTNKPVDDVSWYEALVYCNKLSIREGKSPCYKISGKTNPSEWGAVPTRNDATWSAAECDFTANGYRLPTEAEWEYFAREGNLTNSGQTTYSGSDIIENVAWYYDNACSVGASDPNYGTHQVKTKAKNSLNLYDMTGNVWEWCWDWYGSISSSTPSTGASSGSNRVHRGGGWNNNDGGCSVVYRGWDNPNYRGDCNVGFRVVRSAE
ncbi:MAG: formylglycine-generating enzyme family protein [Treponema sp.]|nr:formylglycine-generating enzyme family protein [Treponema sp.]